MIFLSFLRSLLAAPLFIILTVFFSSLAILASFFPNNTRALRKTIKYWGQSTCFIFGVTVKSSGLENWLHNRGAVVLFSHTSFFDIFTMVGYLPDLRFGAKLELFKIPIFGWAMKRAGILPIDRGQRDRVYQVYEQSVQRLKAGEKIALAPEGARTSTPNVIQNFKAGPFLFALQAHVDFIPVVIKGAHQVMQKDQILPNWRHWHSHIDLLVLQPISCQGFTVETRHELQKKVREAMQAGLNSLLAPPASNPGTKPVNEDVRS